MTNINLTLSTIEHEPYGCECCGSCYPTELNISFNEDIIWSSYFDGHMDGSTTELTILESFLNAFHNYLINDVNLKFTEEKRHEWNKEYYGNSIAANPENWNEEKKTHLQIISDSINNIRTDCDNLPTNHYLQLKMIAIWVESDTGINIQVIKK